MASKTALKTLSEPHKKKVLTQTVDAGGYRPSPLQISKENKAELTQPRILPNITPPNSSNHNVPDGPGGQKLNFVQKELIDSSTASKISKSTDYLETTGSITSSIVQNKPLKKKDSNNLIQAGSNICQEDNLEHKKKVPEIRSFKEGCSSTKLSEGSCVFSKTVGSKKIGDRADIVESRTNSICRGSTGTDVSDESTCSSISSSTNKPHKANDSRWEAIQVVRSRDGVLGLSHFKLLKKLGCGDIGSVYLSELSGTKCYFAMKVMDKGSLESRKKLLRAQTEREILQSLDHPFLPTLYSNFETDKFSCLVMEFCPGGDLHTLRQRQPGKYFPEQAVKFYVAEILLALEYLHMLGIIYRDLKPENVLVREDGHIMLSDFDLSLRCTVSPTLIKSSSMESDPFRRNAYCVQPACIEPSCIQPSCVVPTSCFSPRFFSRSKSTTKDSKKDSKKVEKPKQENGNQVSPMPELIAEPTDARSMSFVGTHEYLAPEIIRGAGHGGAVDWWTFGIFLYELLFGRTPFKGSGNRATLFNVIEQPLRFPEAPAVSFSARDLIKGLLVKEPQHRLAFKRGATEIKQHPFFEGVNWALIRCASPPEVPRPFEIVRPVADVASSSAKPVLVADQKGSDGYLEFNFFRMFLNVQIVHT